MTGFIDMAVCVRWRDGREGGREGRDKLEEMTIDTQEGRGGVQTNHATDDRQTGGHTHQQHSQVDSSGVKRPACISYVRVPCSAWPVGRGVLGCVAWYSQRNCTKCTGKAETHSLVLGRQ